MAVLTKAPRGTQDLLPAQSYKWQYIEQVVADTAKQLGFREIRVPTFEHTELFQRSVGDTTDVVQKEMYTFTDKGNRSITLRPELTAGAARCVIENGLLGDALPLKVFYVGPCFRYEKPQAGRLREFHQFGVELYGPQGYAADAEVINVAHKVLTNLGLTEISLEINSIGCKECRPRYHEKLRAYFESHREHLCETCLSRLEKNPMRILDCKSPECQEIAKDAPKMLDDICDDCRDHFEGLKTRLEAFGMDYKVNSTIVRGLDYYSKTVFEFISNAIGSQGTVCGGGRYDGLIEELGGHPTPALGFGMGLERVLMVMENIGCEFEPEQTCDLYIGSMGERAAAKAQALVNELICEGLSAQCDLMGRSVKAQMKYADKIGAVYSMILGDNEIDTSKAAVKNMKTGEQREFMLDGDFAENFSSFSVTEALESAMDGEDIDLSKLMGLE